MGLFLLILGIFLALNIFPVIFGLLAVEDGDYFLEGFVAAWTVEIILIGAIGFFWLVWWLISTGWTIMHEPTEVY